MMYASWSLLASRDELMDNFDAMGDPMGKDASKEGQDLTDKINAGWEQAREAWDVFYNLQIETRHTKLHREKGKNQENLTSFSGGIQLAVSAEKDRVKAEQKKWAQRKKKRAEKKQQDGAGVLAMDGAAHLAQAPEHQKDEVIEKQSQVNGSSHLSAT